MLFKKKVLEPPVPVKIDNVSTEKIVKESNKKENIYRIDYRKLKELNLDIYYEIHTILSDVPFIYTVNELENKNDNIIKKIISMEEKYYEGFITRELPFQEYKSQFNKITSKEVLSYIDNIITTSPKMFIGYKIPPKGISYNYTINNNDGEYQFILSHDSGVGTSYTVSLINKTTNTTKTYTFDTAISLKKMLIDLYKNKQSS